MTGHTYTVHYTVLHELIDYGLCSDGEHYVLLKIGNIENNHHKDIEMSLQDVKDLYGLIGDFLKGVEE